MSASTNHSEKALTPSFMALLFGGHPAGAAVALANLDIFEREGINENVRANEDALRTTLENFTTCQSLVISAEPDTSTALKWSKIKPLAKHSRPTKVKITSWLPIQSPLRQWSLLPC